MDVDTDGRITNFTNTDGYSNYTYDANDQVTVVDHSYQTDETYTYDANGNRTNTGYTTGTNNRVPSDGTYNYTYDDEGNRISQTKISDSTQVEYTWDYRNRLTDVVNKNASGTVTKPVQYKYDVFDRRIGKKIDATGDGTYESATYWVYDDAGKRDPNTRTALDDIVLEFNDADGDGSGLATLSTRYLHGPGVDQILASEATSGNVVTCALADHQGTVRDMIRYASGTTTVVNHRKYDAFGTVTSESDATVKFLYSYTGREWDGDAGLYYYRARWYDGKIGRFISEDPMGFAAGDTNINRYAGNSTPNAADPSGLMGYEPPETQNHPFDPSHETTYGEVLSYVGSAYLRTYEEYLEELRDEAELEALRMMAEEEIRFALLSAAAIGVTSLLIENGVFDRVQIPEQTFINRQFTENLHVTLTVQETWHFEGTIDLNDDRWNVEPNLTLQYKNLFLDLRPIFVFQSGRDPVVDYLKFLQMGLRY